MWRSWPSSQVLDHREDFRRWEQGAGCRGQNEVSKAPDWEGRGVGEGSSGTQWGALEVDSDARLFD